MPIAGKSVSKSNCGAKENAKRQGVRVRLNQRHARTPSVPERFMNSPRNGKRKESPTSPDKPPRSCSDHNNAKTIALTTTEKAQNPNATEGTRPGISIGANNGGMATATTCSTMYSGTM